MTRVWLNGAILPAAEARIDPSDRGLLLGDGLFETLLAVDGRLPLVDRHLARLSASAAALGIPLPWSQSTIARACEDLLRAEGMAGYPDEDSVAQASADRRADRASSLAESGVTARAELASSLAESGAMASAPPATVLSRRLAALRITLTAGPGARGLLRPEKPRPTLLITAAPQDPAPLPPARLILASTRIAAASPLRRHKTLGYLENLLARREAEAVGADEVLLCNTEGRIAEASAANLFLLREGKLWTPALAEGALPGITRGMVMELARQAGLEAMEGRIELADLTQAEALFLTSSLAGIRPVARLEGFAGEAARVWTGWPATLSRLADAYTDRVHRHRETEG